MEVSGCIHCALGKLPTHIPFSLEALQVYKGLCYGLIGEIGLVLLKQPATSVCVFAFGYGILQVGLFQCIKCDDDAVDLCQRFVKIAFGTRG